MRALIERVDVLLEGSRQLIERSAATLGDDLLPTRAAAPNTVFGTAWLEQGSTLHVDAAPGPEPAP